MRKNCRRELDRLSLLLSLFDDNFSSVETLEQKETQIQIRELVS